MSPEELRQRTERFANEVVEFCIPLFDVEKTRAIADQLIRSGTAVKSNYASAQCGRSSNEFVAKIGQVLDDANESKGWLEMLRDTSLVDTTKQLLWLTQESLELTKIFAKSYSTAKRNQERRKR